MNTNFYIGISGNSSVDWKGKVEEWLSYVAKEWSRFETNNELDRLNQLTVGEILKLSPDLYHCLKMADDYCILTEKLFSPYLKMHLEQHGYHQSFPFKEGERASIKIPEQVGNPFLFLGGGYVKKMGKQDVDLGGFAKGYVVEKIAEWLQHEISPEYGIVDGGGDMKMWSSGEKVWTIGIAHPNNDEQEINYIRIKNGAIATSNRIFRSWSQDGKKKHHLLNGQTGEVIDSQISQTTVVTNSLCLAEVATKLCFLLSEEDLQQWFKKHNLPCACFIVKEDNDCGYWLKEGGGN
ncbi:FAD:protein FMN transferase [Lysinibacillus sp. 54212]|uniref:FAD:protein FMN transferase n=1 Tax=Lysinibacillus sp. 54212 TaxID=3119829 RepID=UPI002FC671A0